MEIILKILRNIEGKEFYQSFRYETKTDSDTVATALTDLNTEVSLKDIDGNVAPPILWDCNCLQKRCGACAMVINGRPGLACASRFDDLTGGSVVTLEPLKKFPLIGDLMVDRSVMHQNLQDLNVWLSEKSAESLQDTELNYEASRCLQCGCCLEVCPNFSVENAFTGMASAVPMTRILSEEGKNSSKAKGYVKKVYEGCGKSLACRNICPAEIDIERMLVNSNAIAVWKRMHRRKEKK